MEFEEEKDNDNDSEIKTYGGCINDADVSKLFKMHKQNLLPRYIVEIEMYGERLIRNMVRLDLMMGWMYADIITGSLYNPKTGKCNSSNIKIVKVRKDVSIVKKKRKPKAKK